MGYSNLPHPSRTERKGDSNLPHPSRAERKGHSNLPHPSRAERKGHSNLPHPSRAERKRDSNLPHPSRTLRKGDSKMPRGFRAFRESPRRSCEASRTCALGTFAHRFCSPRAFSSRPQWRAPTGPSRAIGDRVRRRSTCRSRRGGRIAGLGRSRARCLRAGRFTSRRMAITSRLGRDDPHADVGVTTARCVLSPRV